MKLQFLGGAGTVTGSRTLLTTGKHRVLVDCGLFQGLKEHRLRNWKRFPVDPREIDSVILTHAHLDHSGYLPLLVKQGFKGRIYCSSPTRDLAEILLLDSARIQEEDASFANRRGYSKHSPALPLYDEKDVRECLKHFEKVRADDWNDFPGRIGYRLSPSGHSWARRSSKSTAKESAWFSPATWAGRIRFFIRLPAASSAPTASSSNRPMEIGPTTRETRSASSRIAFLTPTPAAARSSCRALPSVEFRTCSGCSSASRPRASFRVFRCTSILRSGFARRRSSSRTGNGTGLRASRCAVFGTCLRRSDAGAVDPHHARREARDHHRGKRHAFRRAHPPPPGREAPRRQEPRSPHGFPGRGQRGRLLLGGVAELEFTASTCRCGRGCGSSPASPRTRTRRKPCPGSRVSRVLRPRSSSTTASRRLPTLSG